MVKIRFSQNYSSSLFAILNLIIIATVAAKWIKFSDPKIDVIYQELRHCPDIVSGAPIYTKLLKYNRTYQELKGNITFPYVLDDTMRFDLELRRWGQGGWKNNFIRLQRRKACTTSFQVFGPEITSVLVTAGRNASCPVAAGLLEVKSLSVDFTGVPIAITTGRFMLIVKIIDPKKDAPFNGTFLCLQLVMEIKNQIKAN